MKNTDNTALLFKKRVFSKSKPELLKILHSKLIRTQKPLIVFTPNPEQLVLANQSPGFSKILDRADYLLPDGMGLVWASWLLAMVEKGKPFAERITGVDVVTDLLQLSADENWTTVLVGGKGYGNEAMIDGLSNNKLVKSKLHWLEGYRDVSNPTTKEEANLIKQLKKLKPDIVFVAFGAPHQEKWIIDHSKLLADLNTKLAMAVGGSFDMILGKVRRAPLVLRALGLEWLFRLLQQPWRWRRQLRLVKFVSLAMREMLR